jgi:SnoaL-like domain
MSSISDDSAALLHDQLRLLSDRAEIGRLCDRYAMHLDRDRDDDTWLGSVFTEDAWLTFPFGEFKGLDGLADFQEMSRSNFARTHHISSTCDIQLDGDQARARVHLTAVHVPSRDEPARHFVIGGYYEAEAVRTARGWRIRRLVFDLVWHAGEAPGAKIPS